MKKFYLFTFAYFLLCYTSWSQVPSFPGAEGFGANTPGGRGGQVIKVTNLNDHGPGSLRAAVEAEYPRIVIFETGGIINLETELSVRNPFITIAGQTAPGDGICLRGESLRIRTHDVVIRYLRSRPGDIDFGPPNAWDAIDAISIREDAHNVIIDHCSLSWSVDETIDVWQRAHDVTIQYCIIAESLKHSRHPGGAHGMGMLIGSRATRVSVHHNIFAHNNDRNPHINGRSFVDFRNNLIYNPGGVATDVGSNSNQILNYVNNHILAGPNTRIPADILVRNLGRRVPRVYIDGNIGVGKGFTQLFTYGNGRQKVLSERIPEDSAVISQMMLTEAHPAPPVTTGAASQLLQRLPDEVGATRPHRDAVDREIIRDVRNGGHGMVNNKSSLLAWPPYETGFAFVDSDNDGMPDHWEEAYGLNPHRTDDTSDPDGDNYTSIEEYLNDTHPLQQDERTSWAARTLASSSTDSGFPQLDFRINAPYPNPFTDYLNLTFSIDQPSPVAIKVFDVYGREMNELVSSFLYEGKYEIIWDATRTSPGLYHVVMVSDRHVDSAKAWLIR